MGLPHVVVRFYTNPDGRAARRTTVTVLALLGVFYMLPPVYGALGRLYAPDLIVSGRTDAVVLELPRRIVEGTGGDLLSALTAAGAVAAFLSTSSGLTVALSGCVEPGRAQPGTPGGATRWGPVVPGRRRRRRLGPVAGRAAHRGGQRGARRGTGLRLRRLDVLPADRAGDLVAAAHRRGSGGRHERRRRAVRPRRAPLAPRPRPRRLVGSLLDHPAAWTVPAGPGDDGRRSPSPPRTGSRRTSAGPWCGCTPPSPCRSTGACCAPDRSSRPRPTAHRPCRPVRRRPRPAAR